MNQQKDNLFTTVKKQLQKIYPQAQEIRVILTKKVANIYESRIKVVMPHRTLNATKEGENPRVTLEKSVEAIKRQGERSKEKSSFSFKQKKVRDFLK